MAESRATGARLSHVGIAVTSNEAVRAFYQDVLGLESVELSNSDGARIDAFQAGEALVELLEPATAESPIARFLARRGPGIHHLCFAVADLDQALERCRALGIRLVDETPRTGAEGRPIAFLHPASTGGILIELTQR